MKLAFFLAFVVAFAAAQTLDELAGPDQEWQQVTMHSELATYAALVEPAVAVWNSASSVYATFGGRNNTLGGYTWQFNPSTGNFEGEVTNDTLGYPHFIFIFRMFRGMTQ